MSADEIVLLLVEDEPLVLIATQDALEGGGYTVLTASSGDEAMALLDSRIGDICGLITDIRIGPGPDGWHLARHARSLKPDLPIVYATGDSAHDWSVEGVPKSSVVQKPYADAQIVTAISTLLTQTDLNNPT
jgi:CheY-like chemotaxis protein